MTSKPQLCIYFLLFILYSAAQNCCPSFNICMYRFEVIIMNVMLPEAFTVYAFRWQYFKYLINNLYSLTAVRNISNVSTATERWSIPSKLLKIIL